MLLKFWMSFMRMTLLIDNNHGLSRRCDGSHHHKCRRQWPALSPIRERHIRWQIWQSKLLVDGGPDLRRSRLDSNSWIRCTSNSSTADLHEESQSVLSIVNVSNSEDVIPHRFNVVFISPCIVCTAHRTPEAMMELSIEDLLRNLCVIHPSIHPSNGAVHSAEVPLFH